VTVTRYVHTDSSGGDGTTNATSGANAAFSTLADWEAVIDNASLTDDQHCLCTRGTTDPTDSTGVNITFAGESVTNFVRIEGNRDTDSYFDGTVGSGFRKENTAPNFGTSFVVNTDYVYIGGFEFTFLSGGAHSFPISIGGINVIFDSCRINFNGQNSHGMFLNDTNAPGPIAYNCIFYNAASRAADNNGNFYPEMSFYNCGFFNNALAYYGENHVNPVFRNCAFNDNTTDIDAAGTPTGGTSATDKASGLPGTGNVFDTVDTAGVDYTDEANQDWTIPDEDSALYDAGTDIAATLAALWPTFGLLSEGVEGNSRATVWSIGPYEFAAGGGGGAVPHNPLGHPLRGPFGGPVG
jgi:hypothetical protein